MACSQELPEPGIRQEVPKRQTTLEEWKTARMYKRSLEHSCNIPPCVKRDTGATESARKMLADRKHGRSNRRVKSARKVPPCVKRKPENTHGLFPSQGKPPRLVWPNGPHRKLNRGSCETPQSYITAVVWVEIQSPRWNLHRSSKSGIMYNCAQSVEIRNCPNEYWAWPIP